MKVTSKVEHVFTFRELEKDIDSEPRIGVITTATLTWVEYEEPPEDDPDGEMFFLDYKFRGWGCTSTGKISQRQKYESPQSFTDHVVACEFILELIDGMRSTKRQRMDTSEVVVAMHYQVQEWLVKAKQRQQERIERLLK